MSHAARRASSSARGERARALAARAVGVLARGVGRPHGLLGALARGLRGLLGRDRDAAGGDELLAAVALGEHALLAALGRLAQLAVAPVPDAAVARRRGAVEARRQVADLLDDPGVPQQASRDGELVLVAVDEVAQVARARAPAGRVARAGPGARSPVMSTRPPSAPAASSRAPPSRTPSTSPARSSPPSAAATARS